jgi:hypothetical protein
MLVMILALSTICLGQDKTFGGPDSIIAGPFGEPRMVMSEGGEWSYPIKVFANNEVETFVPNITSTGWISWHVTEFREKGTYYTYLYIYHRKSHNTGRETIYVDTHARTVLVDRPLSVPSHFEISKAPLELSKSIAKITTLVTEDAKRFHGMTVQESISREKNVVARMALCSGPGNPSPDCNLSDSDFQKKYPTYATNSQRLIQGAKPGINCGIGTNISCYYDETENSEVNRPVGQVLSSGCLTKSGVGLSKHPGAELGGICALSDTQGVDFSAWLQIMRSEIERTWDLSVPDEVNPPIQQSGMVAIRLKVLPSGHIVEGSQVLEGRSGITKLDEAAWSALTVSSYSPLPEEFHGRFMELRVYFLYNMKNQ